MSRTFHGRLAPRIALVATAAALLLASIAGTDVLPTLAQTHV
jgi:hypothetical protein